MPNYVNNVLICMSANVEGSVEEVDLPDQLEAYWPYNPERGSHVDQYGTQRIDGSVRAVELKGDGTPFMVQVVTEWNPPNQVARDAIAEHVRKAFQCESIQWIATDPYDGSAKVLPLTQLEPKQKEQPPVQAPPRTPQQAMRDARESGAVEAWENGRPIEYQDNGEWFDYLEFDGCSPAFANKGFHWRPKASEPPKPVMLDSRPVSEPPEDGDKVLAYVAEEKTWIYSVWHSPNRYSAWAPQPLPPEVK